MHWICLALIRARTNICQFSERTLSAAVTYREANLEGDTSTHKAKQHFAHRQSLQGKLQPTGQLKHVTLYKSRWFKLRSCVDLLVRMVRTFWEAGKEVCGFIKNSVALSQLCRMCIIMSSRHADQTCLRVYFLPPCAFSNLFPFFTFLGHNVLFKNNFSFTFLAQTAFK